MKISNKILCFLLMFASEAYAGTFQIVYVSKAENNIYTSGKLLIRTRNCYESAFNDEAVLKYNKFDTTNKIMFENGNVCDVVSAYYENK